MSMSSVQTAVQAEGRTSASRERLQVDTTGVIRAETSKETRFERARTDGVGGEQGGSFKDHGPEVRIVRDQGGGNLAAVREVVAEAGLGDDMHLQPDVAGANLVDYRGGVDAEAQLLQDVLGLRLGQRLEDTYQLLLVGRLASRVV
jgi:hypothetical protein